MRNHVYGVDFLKMSLEYVRSRFDSAEASVILRFLEDKQLEGIKEISFYTYVKDLYYWKTYLNGKRFSECTREDIRSAVLYMNSLSLSESAKVRRKVTLKVFFRWLTKEPHPPVTSWITTHMPTTTYIPPGLLLQPEDIAAMFNKAKNIHERAILMLHAEAGDRIGETLSVRIKDVAFEGEFANLLLDGKTGPRPLPVYLSTEHLKELIRVHPFKDNPNAYLFINKFNRPINYSYARHLLRRLAKAAGISKPVNSHNFRHSSITTHAKANWADPKLCAYHGWVQGSQMPKVYIHMAAMDLKETVLETHKDPYNQRDPRQTKLGGFLNA